MNEVLLQTKAHIPRPRPGLVARPRLIDKLDDGLTGKLTLVSAPAGSGKTTLVADWGLAHTRASDLHLAWLSLDEGDNDLPRFVAYIVASLRQVHAKVGEATLSMLAAPQRPSAETLLVALLNDLASRSHRLLLVLDDYHAVEDIEIHDAVDFFLEHQPPSVHLVLISREDPPLPLARRRARGEMTEIRQADLRFTEAETAAFLNDVMGLKLTPDQVAALDARAEGWIAGLHLAALAMQGRDDVEHFVNSFTGSNRYILDYLVEEVFRQQPLPVQRFLLLTSILDRFSAPLCDALLESDVWKAEISAAHTPLSNLRSQSILEQLERTNLFLVPLGEERRWFRYHHLFADLLRHRLRRQGWATDDLHGRAARWYEDNEMHLAAIGHYLVAHHWEKAADLLSAHSEKMLRQGATQALLRWMGLLPEPVVRRRPLLCLNYGWALVLKGQLDAAESYLKYAGGAASDDPALRHGVLSARSYVARMRNDVAQTIALSEEALALTPPGDHNTRSVLNVGLGIAYWQSGQLDKAAQALIATGNDALRAENLYAHLIAAGFLGTVRAAQGKLHRAADSLRAALDRAQAHPAAAVIHITLGALLYEWNDLQGATGHVKQAIALARRIGNAEVLEGAYRQLARLEQAQGNPAGALAALDKAMQATGVRSSALTQSRVAAAYVQLALSQEDLDLAAHWAKQRTIPVDASPFYLLLDLTPARLHLARGDRQAAAGTLATQYERARAAGWQYGCVETRLLQALAAPDEAAALSFLEEAVTLAQPEGYIRAFVDKGNSLALLLEKLAGPEQPRELLRYLHKLLSAFTGPPGPELAPPLIEPLSKREQEILSLLCENRTNAEIAQALVVSINTVKTHLQHIYGKLGVHNRRAAVARARELLLLPVKTSEERNEPS